MKKVFSILTVVTVLFVFSQSAMAEYKLKPAGEIGKNLFGMGLKKAKENPDQVEKAAKKMTGENETESQEVDKDKKDKKEDKNGNE